MSNQKFEDLFVDRARKTAKNLKFLLDGVTERDRQLERKQEVTDCLLTFTEMLFAESSVRKFKAMEKMDRYSRSTVRLAVARYCQSFLGSTKSLAEWDGSEDAVNALMEGEAHE